MEQRSGTQHTSDCSRAQLHVWPFRAAREASGDDEQYCEISPLPIGRGSEGMSMRQQPPGAAAAVYQASDYRLPRCDMGRKVMTTAGNRSQYSLLKNAA
jgi:hypothetical protein